MLTIRRPAALALTAALCMLAMLLLLVPGAIAHALHSSAGPCTGKSAGHRATHGSARHCAKQHHASHRSAAQRRSTGKSREGGADTTLALVPATCADESLPVRSASGAYTCEDGSEPACEDGVGALVSKTGEPLCLPPGVASEEAVKLECENSSGGDCASEEVVCDSEPTAGSAEGQCELVAEETSDDS